MAPTGIGIWLYVCIHVSPLFSFSSLSIPSYHHTSVLMMKSIIASSLLLSLLLRQATAVPSIEARQEVEIESVNLRYKSQCKRTSEISNAWDDAIRLATTLPKINWNEAAAVDFFGPPALNSKESQSNKALFLQTLTPAQRTTSPKSRRCSTTPKPLDRDGKSPQHHLRS